MSVKLKTFFNILEYLFHQLSVDKMIQCYECLFNINKTTIRNQNLSRLKLFFDFNLDHGCHNCNKCSQKAQIWSLLKFPKRICKHSLSLIQFPQQIYSTVFTTPSGSSWLDKGFSYNFFQSVICFWAHNY